MSGAILLVMMFLLPGGWQTFAVPMPTMEECHKIIYARMYSGAYKNPVEIFSCERNSTFEYKDRP